MKSFNEYLREADTAQFDESLLWDDEFFFETYEEELLEAKLIHKKFDQPWMSQITGDMSPNEVYNLAYDKYAEKTKAELNRLLTKIGGSKAKVLTDIKGDQSWVSKTYSRKRGYNIDDLVRGALLVDSPEDLDRAVKAILKLGSDVMEHDVKERQTGGDKDTDYGYFGSHHFAIRMKTGVVVEVQVMTKKLWNYKHEGHKIYTKLRDPGSNIDPNVRAKEMDRSRGIFQLGNRANAGKGNKKK